MREEILKAGKTKLGLRPDLGGCVSFLESNGFHWLRALEGEDHRKCASYPLVPFSNRIDQARFTWQGQEIQLNRNFAPEPHAIHGHGWQNLWQILEQTDKHCRLSYHHSASDWPWDYETNQQFSLDADHVTFKMDQKNLSDISMPAGLGFHPFFNLDEGADLQMTSKAKHEAEGCIPITRDETHPVLGSLNKGAPVPAGHDDVFDGWDGNAVITWPKAKRQLTLQASGNARHMVFYSPEGRGYFCVESVTHMTDAINRLQDPDWADHGLKTLKPGASLKLEMAFILKNL